MTNLGHQVLPDRQPGLFYGRTCPGGQIQLNLGHQSLATTQVYLGTDLDLRNGPGDFLDINIE